MKPINFGIIGCGLMGKEFASAASRWCHLNTEIPAPRIVALADPNPSALEWFKDKLPDVKYVFQNYKELLELREVDAVYCAVPHIMHEDIYCDIINAGKHLLGEKPFGMDKKQNEEILKAIKANPKVFVRCSSQFPFFPGCQELIKMYRDKRLGRIIEVRAGIKHSSDMDLNKPINWKRKVEINGEYGCMGDLGIHCQHVPFKLGFIPKRVYAQLSKIVKERPDGKGGMAKCETWDNAIMNCCFELDGEEIPMILETKRMSPGSTNEWYMEIYGLEASAKFSTNDPNALYFTQAVGREQAWCRVNVGYKPQFPTITGSIFEFGFPDAILQMWAAFILEMTGGKVDFGCFTPEETIISHALQTAALESYKTKSAVELKREY
jgi:Predicted dehydrogenases and related proteins